MDVFTRRQDLWIEESIPADWDCRILTVARELTALKGLNWPASGEPFQQLARRGAEAAGAQAAAMRRHSPTQYRDLSQSERTRLAIRAAAHAMALYLMAKEPVP